MKQRKVLKNFVEDWRKLEKELLDTGHSARTAHCRIGTAYGVSRSTVRRYLVEGESGCGDLLA